MDRQLPPGVAQAAAGWWADHLRKLPVHDWGETNVMAQALSLLATDTAMKKTEATEEKVGAFQRELAAAIEREYVAGHGQAGAAVFLDVDYQPCGLLSEAGRKAGLASLYLLLPFKTFMRIEEGGSIEVKEGYGAPWRPLPVPASAGRGAVD